MKLTSTEQLSNFAMWLSTNTRIIKTATIAANNNVMLVALSPSHVLRMKDGNYS